MQEDFVPEPTLNDLVEIVDPEPISNAPATTAWIVLIAILALVALWVALLLWRRWQRGAYRRAALARLDALWAAGNAAELPVLVKHVALEAWPREEVAELSGEEWLTFLDESYGGDGFTSGPGRALPDLAYGANGNDRLDDDLIQLIRIWILTHRA